MQVEQLLQMLREDKLDDEAIKKLLSDALALLDEHLQEHEAQPEPNEDEEKAEAQKLLGVAL